MAGTDVITFFNFSASHALHIGRKPSVFLYRMSGENAFLSLSSPQQLHTFLAGVRGCSATGSCCRASSLATDFVLCKYPTEESNNDLIGCHAPDQQEIVSNPKVVTQVDPLKTISVGVNYSKLARKQHDLPAGLDGITVPGVQISEFGRRQSGNHV